MKPYKRFFHKIKNIKKDRYLKSINDEAISLAYFIGNNNKGCWSGPLFEKYMFYEEVINVKIELQEIHDVLITFFEKHMGESINVLIPYIEKKLEKFKIKFGYSHIESKKYTDFNRYDVETDIIYIMLTNKVLKDVFKLKDYEEFITDISNLLGHEFVHRHERIKIKNDELAKKLLKQDPRKVKKYYGSKYEIMAYAWQIVDNFRVQGKNDFVTKELLKYDNFVKFRFGGKPLETYHDIFTMQDAELKLLYKYMYMYLE